MRSALEVEDIGPCVEVAIGKDKQGYGQGRIAIGGRSYFVKAHRIAFEKAWGITLAPDQVVRHTCDNTSCVNPLHLMVGTVADNNRDKKVRGRTIHPNALKTVCKRGHAFNTDPRTGRRWCQTCKSEMATDRRWRKISARIATEGAAK